MLKEFSFGMLNYEDEHSWANPSKFEQDGSFACWSPERNKQLWHERMHVNDCFLKNYGRLFMLTSMWALVLAPVHRLPSKPIGKNHTWRPICQSSSCVVFNLWGLHDENFNSVNSAILSFWALTNGQFLSSRFLQMVRSLWYWRVLRDLCFGFLVTSSIILKLKHLMNL